MARYVEGFILAVPKKNSAAYARMAKKAGKIWIEHGALEFCECIAEDVKPGKLTSFPQAVKLKAGEVAWFSWITYKSRKDRDRVNAAIMADPRVAKLMPPAAPMLFDGKRMIIGGFEVRVDL